MNSYEAFYVEQRPGKSTVPFIIFVANASEVSSWAQADDIRIDQGNVQRELIESRWKQVRKFFLSSTDNVIPTSITIAFSDELVRVSTPAQLSEDQPAYYMSEPQNGKVTITFPNCVQPQSFVIDGQHRLKGMEKLEEPVLVPICLFPSLSSLERAFQFIVINNKSHKVPTNNLKALIRNFEEIQNGLRHRLAHASITAPHFATHIDILNESSDSPFYKAVDWVNNRHADGKLLIQPTALENSLKAITRAFPDTKDDPADAILVLNAIWDVLFAQYGVTLVNMEQWPNLILKSTIQGLSEMIVARLAKDLDPAFSQGSITNDNAASARAAANALISDIPAEFWKEEWARKGLDTSAGRDLIAQAIRKLKMAIHENPDVEDFDWRVGNPLYMRSEPGEGELG